MDKAVVREEMTNGGTLRLNARIFGFVWFLIKWVAPAAIVTIFVTNLLL